jgi:mannose/fructose/N-acetylgalactosamine-specific phosphotransferase system component IIC
MQKKRKKTAFVPRFVFATACAGSVVPLCVTSCGGAVQQDADAAVLGVADVTFDVAAPFDAPHGAHDVAAPFGVADLGFDVAAPFDGGVADLGFHAADSGDAPDDHREG